MQNQNKPLLPLVIGAIGVVFGDIGTSPLYAFKESLSDEHGVAVDRIHILGVLSLIFWTILVVVSVKYVVYVMRTDNRGEGGSLALLARLHNVLDRNSRSFSAVTGLGILAAALFYGDSIITPAVSVLSAVEGLYIAAPALGEFVIPITVTILLALFLIQRFGTEMVGNIFGPVCLVWFLVIGFLGLRSIIGTPSILAALSPHYGWVFIFTEPGISVSVLGAVVLSVTGAEALYADMGHFGRTAIRIGWHILVMPCLLLNYFGQGALLLRSPEAVENPFFLLAPQSMLLPLVILATLATIIASQAVISGAFSLTRQAIQLGYLPRMTIIHTSGHEIGQIYMPTVNMCLMVSCIALVLGFKTSSNLAAAYGVAVTGNMVITAMMMALAMKILWGWDKKKIFVICGIFLGTDLMFFLSCAIKIPDGGWVPVSVASVIVIILMTWKAGRALLLQQLQNFSRPESEFNELTGSNVAKVPGTAIFLTSIRDGLPLSLLHNLRHNKVVHERVVLLSAVTSETPLVSDENRLESREIAPGLQRIILHYGFMETPNIPKTLAHISSAKLGFFYEPQGISWFLSRETVIEGKNPGMAPWRIALFIAMARGAADTMRYFRLPPNRLIELGTQVEI